VRAEPGAHRVEDDVPRDAERVGIPLHEPRLEPAFEEVADAVVAAVEARGVDAVQLAHPEREVRVRRLHHQVEVITHQAVGMADPAVAFDDLREDTEEPLPVGRVAEDRGAFVAAGVDVVEGVLELDAQRPGHDARVQAFPARRKTAVAAAACSDVSECKEARPDPARPRRRV
jgi:hypothetical protein